MSLACGYANAHPDHAAHTDDETHPQHHDNLGSEATNPVAPLMSLRLQYQNSPSSYNADGYSQAAIFQAVVPIALSSKAVPRLLNRVTTPYVSTPDLAIARVATRVRRRRTSVHHGSTLPAPCS